MKGWKCYYCSESLWNRQLDRLLGHFSCDKELCSKIQPCSVAAVPEEVRDAIRSKLTMEANVNASAVKRKAQSADVENAGDAERARLVQGRMRRQTVEVCQVNAAPILHRLIAILWSLLAHENIDMALVIKYA